MYRLFYRMTRSWLKKKDTDKTQQEADVTYIIKINISSAQINTSIFFSSCLKETRRTNSFIHSSICLQRKAKRFRLIIIIIFFFHKLRYRTKIESQYFLLPYLDIKKKKIRRKRRQNKQSGNWIATLLFRFFFLFSLFLSLFFLLCVCLSHRDLWRLCEGKNCGCCAVVRNFYNI